MGQVAELNTNVQYDLSVTKFGSSIDALLALAIQSKSVFNAHAHSGTGVAPSTSISAANPTGVDSTIVGVGGSWALVFARMKQDLEDMSLPGNYIGVNFVQMWTDCVSLALDFKTKFNAHTHAAIDGAPGSSISLGLTISSVSPNLEENWNRGFDLSYKTQLGTKMKQLVVVLGSLKTQFNAHAHPTAMTNVTTSTVAAADPSTLTP